MKKTQHGNTMVSFGTDQTRIKVNKFKTFPLELKDFIEGTYYGVLTLLDDRRKPVLRYESGDERAPHILKILQNFSEDSANEMLSNWVCDKLTGIDISSSLKLTRELTKGLKHFLKQLGESQQLYIISLNCPEDYKLISCMKSFKFIRLRKASFSLKAGPQLYRLNHLEKLEMIDVSLGSIPERKEFMFGLRNLINLKEVMFKFEPVDPYVTGEIVFKPSSERLSNFCHVFGYAFNSNTTLRFCDRLMVQPSFARYWLSEITKLKNIKLSVDYVTIDSPFSKMYSYVDPIEADILTYLKKFD